MLCNKICSKKNCLFSIEFISKTPGQNFDFLGLFFQNYCLFIKQFSGAIWFLSMPFSKKLDPCKITYDPRQGRMGHCWHNLNACQTIFLTGLKDFQVMLFKTTNRFMIRKMIKKINVAYLIIVCFSEITQSTRKIQHFLLA